MTCGQDKTIKLWNPHRDGVEKPKEALLIKTYKGRHGYDVQDVALYGTERSSVHYLLIWSTGAGG